MTSKLVVCIFSVIFVGVFIMQLAQGDENNIARFTKISCLSIDPEYIANSTCRVKPVRRGLYYLNIRSTFLQPVNNVFFHIKLFKKANVYKPFLIDVTENFCDFLSKKHVSPYMKIIGDIYLPYSNVNTSCPLQGEVILKDMPLDASHLPSIWPTGEYRLDIYLNQFKKLIITLQCDFVLEERRIKSKPLLGSD